MSVALPLVQVLDAELVAVDEFLALLQQEQAALIENTLNQLVEFAKAKAGKAQALELLGRERKRLFIANGVVIDDDPPHRMLSIARLPESEWLSIAERWQRLLLNARHASALNQTNGTLIETRQQQNQQLMTLLHHSGTTLSYDAYGLPRLAGSGSSLGKA